MRSTMQETPLSIATLVRYGTSVYGDSEVHTWTGEGARSATYREVGQRSAQLAHALRGLGVQGDDRVATFMWNNQEHLEVYCAVPGMGAVLHPLNIRLFPDQIAYIADHAQDKVVVVDGSVLPMLAPILARVPSIQHVVVSGAADLSLLAGCAAQVHSYDELIADQPTKFDWVEVDETDAVALCYTSGTTGNPRGVAYSHRSAYLHSMQMLMGEAMPATQQDRLLVIVPMFHVMAWGLPWAALMCGASLVMPDRFLAPGPLAQAIETLRPTVGAGVPTVWTALLANLDATPRDVSSLTLVLIGGSACSRALMQGLEERHGIRVTHAWGMTETSPVGSVAHEPAGVTGDDVWSYRVTQGRLVAGMQARLAGPGGELVPRDGEAVGELEVRGPWVTGSYYLDDDASRFHDGWLRTGDVGRISPDGYLTLTDRAKDVIKSGGEWISSVELENALMGHPAIAEASVVGVPDEKWGERPLAAVVVKEGVEVSVADLRAHLAASVASWQLPERWAFIEEVPKTSVGKFDKKVLRARYAAGELDVRTVAVTAPRPTSLPGPGGAG